MQKAKAGAHCETAIFDQCAKITCTAAQVTAFAPAKLAPCHDTYSDGAGHSWTDERSEMSSAMFRLVPERMLEARLLKLGRGRSRMRRG